MGIAFREQGKLATGLIYQAERPALEQEALNADFPPAALQDISVAQLKPQYQKTAQTFMR